MPFKQNTPETLAAQRASNELVKLIRKLRWMGMEEAEKMEKQLSKRTVPTADCVLALTRETD